MSEAATQDAIDKIIAQWSQERPDLDLPPMATIGRIKRLAALLEDRLMRVFSKYNLSYWEFDVLATLRRSGTPFLLTPTELFSTLMITSGTMTHRLKQMEAKGLIHRIPNPDDARSLQVQLSPKGFELIEKAVSDHVDNLHDIVSPLEKEDQLLLDLQLKKLLKIIDA